MNRLYRRLIAGSIVTFGAVGLMACSPTKTENLTTTTAAQAPATPTTAKPEAHVPEPADFALELIETERSCFGSAGCNISYQVKPSYTGPKPMDDSSYTVIYNITGGEDTKTANFNMKGENANGNFTGHISTGPNPTLGATVTKVVKQ